MNAAKAEDLAESKLALLGIESRAAAFAQLKGVSA
jgi:hypothetical protein